VLSWLQPVKASSRFLAMSERSQQNGPFAIGAAAAAAIAAAAVVATLVSLLLLLLLLLLLANQVMN